MNAESAINSFHDQVGYYVHTHIIKYIKAYKTRLGKYSWLEQYVKPVVLLFLVYFEAPPFVQVSEEILFVLCSYYSFPLLLRVDLLFYKTRINTIEHGCHVMARFLNVLVRTHEYTSRYSHFAQLLLAFSVSSLWYILRMVDRLCLGQSLKENRLVLNMGSRISD